MDWIKINEWREFLRDNVREEVDFSTTDQNNDIPMPPVEKPWVGGEVISLPGEETFDFQFKSFMDIIRDRESRRVFDQTEMKLKELSFLLWATQGVRSNKPNRILRHVPSAGNRHSAETYLAVFRVEGLKQGIYRYLPLEHQIGLVRELPDLWDHVNKAAHMQLFASRCNVLFLWTSLPYRTEWRYGHASAKVFALDLGHICQNLYLACEAIGYGTCAIAAYDQKASDQLLGVDGKDEFTVYLAPVGKQKTRS
ncbi:SagB/ThcOx family dehydrogenase [Proteiniclasticum sp. QWL-01]|uniref:SagB/ThcOx family dehydrogenase n=1 Tax=Proteiniclasticum sp. QWL-01 TaxID=3036945 RepID=UPI00240FB448|nr:SagB/ThcOx family dehydrogenase [Proteiniclasticum sp. QWL-01]WFF71748.1 SagB/ThcOx family dehydrogenase [Proteiniclasticum sp. QWL-01]